MIGTLKWLEKGFFSVAPAYAGELGAGSGLADHPKLPGAAQGRECL